MAKRGIVLDNSSSVFLAKLGLIKTLAGMFNLITTEDIKKEIEEGVKEGYRDAHIRMGFIQEGMIKIQKPGSLSQIMKEYELHKADASILALAKETDYILATEDRQIKYLSKLLKIKNTNASILIHFLYKKKKLSKQQSFTLLDLLEKWSYNKEMILKIKQVMQNE